MIRLILYLPPKVGIPKPPPEAERGNSPSVGLLFSFNELMNDFLIPFCFQLNEGGW